MRTPPRRGPRSIRRADACPLSLWRTRGPSAISRRQVAVLAEAVSATAILGERRWSTARDGDRAAAVAVAIDRLHRKAPDGPQTDLVMGNLVVLARRDGDATARVVLSHALRALARRNPDRKDLPSMADAWSGRTATMRGRRIGGRS